MLSNLKKIILDRPGLDKNIKRIIILESIDSTNLYAKSLQNPLDSTIVIASSQIKGRGRKNREWKSFGHKNVAISIIFSLFGSRPVISRSIQIKLSLDCNVFISSYIYLFSVFCSYYEKSSNRTSDKVLLK